MATPVRTPRAAIDPSAHVEPVRGGKEGLKRQPALTLHATMSLRDARWKSKHERQLADVSRFSARRAAAPARGFWLDAIAVAWLVRPVFRWRFVLRGSLPALGLVSAALWLHGQARAAGGTLAEEARALIGELEGDAAVLELVNPATTRAKDALSRAEAAAPERAAFLEAAALEWAQVGRDLKRAKDAEQASDRLEQELSALQTENVRSRAAVEQAKARVGRARQELLELEAGAAKSSAARPAAGASAPGAR